MKAQLHVVYYAGHGAEYQGHNYLIPVDADMSRAEAFARTSFLLDELRRSLDKLKSGVSILILDTCRVKNSPSGHCRGVEQTLKLTAEKKSSGTLIAYPTGHGERASDGHPGSHSVYTDSLLQRLDIQGLPEEALFRCLTERVFQRTDGLQKPEFVNGLMGVKLCLRFGPQGQCKSEQELCISD